MQKSFKWLLTLVLMFGLMFAVASCKKDEVVVVIPPIEEETPPIEEETPPVEEEAPPVEEEKPVIIDGKMVIDVVPERGVFQTTTFSVEGYSEITIIIKGENIYNEMAADIPVDIKNFTINGEAVEWVGDLSTSYEENFVFKIGEQDAVAKLVNLRAGENFGLHNWHKTKGTEHFIKINVKDLKTFGFDFAVTTGAFGALEGFVVEFK